MLPSGSTREEERGGVKKGEGSATLLSRLSLFFFQRAAFFLNNTRQTKYNTQSGPKRPSKAPLNKQFPFPVKIK